MTIRSFTPKLEHYLLASLMLVSLMLASSWASPAVTPYEHANGQANVQPQESE